MKKLVFPNDAAKASPKLWWRSAFLWVPLVALLDTLLIELLNHKVFTTGMTDFFSFVSDHPLALLVNFLLVLMTMTPAFFLRRRAFWCALLSAAWLAGGGANGFILLNRMTPFTTADLTVLNTGLDTLPNYLSRGYLILLAVSVVLLAVLLVLLIWEGPRNRDPLRKRLLVGAAAMLLTGGCLAGCWNWAFHVHQLSATFSNLAFAYDDYGFAYCFLQTWLNKGIRQPAGYSAEKMQEIRDRITTDAEAGADGAAAQTDVNVLYVQLESFMDPQEVKGLELSEDALPYWHQLEKEFTSGYLTVPVVGAGTANTEFEVLTGMSSRLFGPGEYPYKTCLQNKTVESVAYDLSALGYGTHAIHNHRATFYTRNIVYANLGFDDFTSLEYMPKVQKTPKGWSRDYILTQEITEALNATPDQPDLVFTVSVEGHGSYPKEELLTNPEIRVTACPEHCNATSVEYYVNQIHDMDTFVQRLTEELSKRDEKTILVLYGDHLPSLNLEKHDMESGSLYKTRYIIWNNFDLEKQDADLYAYQLTGAALDSIGIHQGEMTQFQQYCREEPTYRTDMKAIQYDVLYGRNYFYNGESPYAPTDMKMGVSKIQVLNLYQKDDAWYVQGRNFSPYCKVTVDGKILETKYISTHLLELLEDPGTEDYRDLVISVVDMHHEILSDTE